MASTSLDLAILADSNVQDPKPATLVECLGREYSLVRVTTFASFIAYEPPEGLRYLVVACLSPLVAEFAGVADEDERELRLGIGCFNFGFSSSTLFIFFGLSLFTGEASLDLTKALASWLEARPKVYVMLVPPLFRSVPSTFKEDTSSFMVLVCYSC